jgi:hypothetical protein
LWRIRQREKALMPTPTKHPAAVRVLLQWPDMQTIRRLRWLARCVLAWFVMSLAVAVAAPVVSPQSMELVCTGSGAIKLLVQTDDGAQELSSHTLDCPLCVHVGAPPPAMQARLPQPHPLAHALLSIPAAHIASRTAAPLPPRGPPLFS